MEQQPSVRPSLVTMVAAMPPPSRLCLLVLLGALVEPATLMDPPPELSKILDDISNDVDLRSPKISTHPPFEGVIRSIRECQNREEVKLVKAALDVYTHILESILHNATLLNAVSDQARRGHLRGNLTHLTNKTLQLSANLASLRQNCTKTSDVLHELKQLKVDNVTVQQQALSQFRQVYNMATALAPSTLASL